VDVVGAITMFYLNGRDKFINEWLSGSCCRLPKPTHWRHLQHRSAS